MGYTRPLTSHVAHAQDLMPPVSGSSDSAAYAPVSMPPPTWGAHQQQQQLVPQQTSNLGMHTGSWAIPPAHDDVPMLPNFPSFLPYDAQCHLQCHQQQHNQVGGKAAKQQGGAAGAQQPSPMRGGGLQCHAVGQLVPVGSPTDCIRTSMWMQPVLDWL